MDHKQLKAFVIEKVEDLKGRDIIDLDVAEKLQVSIESYHQMLNEVNAGKIIGIEDLGVTEDVISTQQTKSSDTPFEDFLQGFLMKTNQVHLLFFVYLLLFGPGVC